MAQLVEASFKGSDQVTLTRLRTRVSAVLKGLGRQLDREMIELRTYIVSQKLSGQVLNRRSGTLSDSVHEVAATVEGETVTAGIDAAGGPAFYGAFFENGGDGPYFVANAFGRGSKFAPKVPARTAIIQVAGVVGRTGNLQARAQAMAKAAQGTSQQGYVHPPVPKKPWFQVSLDENRDKIQTNLLDAVQRAVKGTDAEESS